jgi:hypothetical protein
MIRNILVTLLVLIGCGGAVGAMADCVYDGQIYKTGTVVDGLTCQDDGTWR